MPTGDPPHSTLCPNCGHCPTCGKSNWKPQPWPYGTFYPNYYYQYPQYPTNLPYYFTSGGTSVQSGATYQNLNSAN